MARRPVTDLPSLRSTTDFDAAFDRAFAAVAFALNRHLVDHMLRCARQVTGGDLDALVVLGVLAHQNIAHLMPPGTVPTALLSDRGRLTDTTADVMRPMLLRDIAEITRMPRETVRRKLAKLETLGLARRVDRGWTVSDARAEPELRDFTRESTLRLLATADEIRGLLDSARATSRRQPSART